MQEFYDSGKIWKNIWCSPLLWSISLPPKNSKKQDVRYRKWQIFVSTDNKNISLNREILLGEKYIPDTVGIYWTIKGFENGKLTKSDPTRIVSGKNLGKANATTPISQAMSQAHSLFKNLIRKGASVNKNELLVPNELSFKKLLKIKTRENPWRVFPMALHDVNKNNWKNISYPGYIQPKYDGTRFLVVYSPEISEISGFIKNMDGWSRSRETYYGQNHILQELKPILQKYPSLYIDGELWKPGYSLQHISGTSRCEKKQSEIKLNYYIFDSFYIDDSEIWESRRERINNLFSQDFTYINLTPDKKYKNKKELLDIYKSYLDQDLEGGVLRNSDSLYEFGISRERRSYTTMKIKPIDDDEWELIGWLSGEKGKDADALKWKLRTTPEICKNHAKKYNRDFTILAKNSKESEFIANPKGAMGDYESRRKALKFLENNPDYFNKKLKGQFMTVQFSTLSDYGKPQQPKVLGFKNHDLQEEFMKKIQE